MWPSRWFTATNAEPVARTRAFAAESPTISAPTSPGPRVTATPSMSEKRRPPASSSVCSSKGFSVSTWARAATSGTTPPKRRWRSTWLATRFARSVKRSSTTAIAVSSHDVSIPRTLTRVSRRYAGGVSRTHVLGSLLHDLLQSRGVRGRLHVVDPHDQRVLSDLLVVVLADADRSEAEATVEALGPPVGDAHLEGDRARSHLDRRGDELVHQAR